MHRTHFLHMNQTSCAMAEVSCAEHGSWRHGAYIEACHLISSKGKDKNSHRVGAACFLPSFLLSLLPSLRTRAERMKMENRKVRTASSGTFNKKRRRQTNAKTNSNTIRTLTITMAVAKLAGIEVACQQPSSSCRRNLLSFLQHAY